LNFEEILGEPANDDYRKLNAHLDIKSVINVLNKLKAQENRLIQLSIYGGMSHNEIAEAVGLPVGTVKSHIRRGLKKIKKSFGLRELKGATS
jgi:RNA polymerase sigma-70 factor (ECF subfamily)